MEYQYDNISDLHVIELSNEDMDKIFYDVARAFRVGFDLPHASRQYFHPPVRDWFETQAVSTDGYPLYSITMNADAYYCFRFYRKHLAMQFKLMWG
jgi:hypothetical protein